MTESNKMRQNKSDSHIAILFSRNKNWEESKFVAAEMPRPARYKRALPRPSNASTERGGYNIMSSRKLRRPSLRILSSLPEFLIP